MTVNLQRDDDDAGSAPEVVKRLVQKAEAAGASDIHLQLHERSASVSFRLDGVMTPTAELTADLAERVFGRIKFLARLQTYQESLPQDGRIERAALETRNDIRVATYPTVTGEKIVLRLFHQGEVKSFAQLEFPADARTELDHFLQQTAGLLLLTGPAGAGKTTTIYACLQALTQASARHIITVEDPVEQILNGVMQTEVNEPRGLDFARAARHLLRQDPEVLVIGEIRDEETATICVRAALTGHLVISTLHAGSCKGVLERLFILCPDHSAVASSLNLIINQRLVRQFCTECNSKGCAACLQSGYRGRVPLVEWLKIDGSLRPRLVARNFDAIQVNPTLAQRARVLVDSGITNETEINRVLGFQWQ